MTLNLEKKNRIFEEVFSSESITNKHIYRDFLLNPRFIRQNYGSIPVEWNISMIEGYRPSKKTVSVSFYKKKTYHGEGKDFSRYRDGLQTLLKDFIKKRSKDIFYTWKFRIYYDMSVFKEITIILKNLILDGTIQIYNIHLIELYQYKVPRFMNERPNYSNFHQIESIGMLFRFLPMMKNMEREDDLHNRYHTSEQTFVSDIDTSPGATGFSYLKLKLIQYFMENNIEFGFKTKEGHQYYLHQFCYPGAPPKFWVVINNFVYQNGVYYPIQLFDMFIEKSFTNTTIRNQIQHCGMREVFDYGYDEFFTNDYMLKYFLEHNVKICLGINYGFYGIFIGILTYYYRNGRLEEIKPYLLRLLQILGVTQEDINREEFMETKNKKCLNVEKNVREPNVNGSPNRSLPLEYSLDLKKLYELFMFVDICITSEIHRKIYAKLKNIWTDPSFPLREVFGLLHEMKEIHGLPIFLKRSISINEFLYSHEVNASLHRNRGYNESYTLEWRQNDVYIITSNGYHDIKINKLFLSTRNKKYKKYQRYRIRNLPRPNNNSQNFIYE